METFHPSLCDGMGAGVRMSHRKSGIYLVIVNEIYNIIVMSAAVTAAIVTAAVTAADVTHQDFSDYHHPQSLTIPIQLLALVTRHWISCDPGFSLAGTLSHYFTTTFTF